MNDLQIKLIADRVLQEQLGKYGYMGAEVRSGLDHSDEPAVYVKALLGEGGPAMEPTTLMSAHLALSDALLAEGEERFPYLETKRSNDDDRPEEMILRPLRRHS